MRPADSAVALADLGANLLQVAPAAGAWTVAALAALVLAAATADVLAGRAIHRRLARVFPRDT